MLCLSEDYVLEDVIWKLSNLILRIKELQMYYSIDFFILKNISEITKEILMNEVNDERLKNILSKESRSF